MFVGEKREQCLAKQITSGLDVPVTDLVGQTSLLELAAICQGAKLYAGTESGPLQIAAAAGKNTHRGHHGRRPAVSFLPLW